MIPLAILTVLTVTAAVYQWRKVRADEQAPIKADPREAFCAALDRSMVDEHRCEQCHAVAPVREIVPLYDGAALVCVPCASVLRVAR